MRNTLTTIVKGQRNPFIQNPALGGGLAVGSVQMFRRFRDLIGKAYMGQGIGTRVDQRVKAYYSTQTAAAVITCAGVLAADTVTLNGVALTAVTGAATNNQFDRSGTDTQTATNLAAAIIASTTSLVGASLVAGSRTGVVTLASVAAGDFVLLGGTRLNAINATTDSGGNRITTFPPDVFGMNGTDTADATALVNCINSHPRLREIFLAESSAGAVTVRERYPSVGSEATLLSSNGTRLAVTVAAATTGLMAAGASVLIEALHSGTPGNQATIASSTGVRLAIGGSVSRLFGGATTLVTF